MHDGTGRAPTRLEVLSFVTGRDLTPRLTAEDLARRDAYKTPIGIGLRLGYAADATKYPDNPPPLPYCGACGERAARCPCDWRYTLPMGVLPASPEARAYLEQRAAAGIAPVPEARTGLEAAPSGERAADIAPTVTAEVQSFAPVPRLEAWTDGSGTRATELAGIGVVIARGREVLCEASECIGRGSSNVAEVRAIGRALALLRVVGGSRTGRVRIHSDSEFAIGAVRRGSLWQISPKREVLAALVGAVRAEVEKWPTLDFLHVPGHSGIKLNERADVLAGRARKLAVAMAREVAA